MPDLNINNNNKNTAEILTAPQQYRQPPQQPYRYDHQYADNRQPPSPQQQLGPSPNKTGDPFFDTDVGSSEFNLTASRLAPDGPYGPKVTDAGYKYEYDAVKQQDMTLPPPPTSAQIGGMTQTDKGFIGDVIRNVADVFQKAFVLDGDDDEQQRRQQTIAPHDRLHHRPSYPQQQQLTRLPDPTTTAQ